MLDALRPGSPPSASRIALGVGFGALCLLLAVYPPSGEYSVLGGITVRDRGDLTVVGTVLAASIVPAYYALGRSSGVDERVESLSRGRRLLVFLLVCFGLPAAIQLVSVSVITVKSVLVGLGSSVLLVTLAGVVFAKQAGSGSSVG